MLPTAEVHYPQCEWLADGERCRYPGSISMQGPWFCTGHHRCSDREQGAAIVERSRSYVYPTREQRVRAFEERE